MSKFSIFDISPRGSCCGDEGKDRSANNEVNKSSNISKNHFTNCLLS